VALYDGCSAAASAVLRHAASLPLALAFAKCRHLSPQSPDLISPLFAIFLFVIFVDISLPRHYFRLRHFRHCRHAADYGHASFRFFDIAFLTPPLFAACFIDFSSHFAICYAMPYAFITPFSPLPPLY
jgi:hypothetical protein